MSPNPKGVAESFRVNIATVENPPMNDALSPDPSNKLDSFVSPDWHAAELAETEAAAARGEEISIDWAEAKHMLKHREFRSGNPSRATSATPLGSNS